MTASGAFNNIRNRKAITIEAPLKIKCLPIFFFPFFFLTIITHLCQAPVFLILWFGFENVWLLRALVLVSLSQDTAYSENPSLVSSSSPGLGQAMT